MKLTYCIEHDRPQSRYVMDFVLRTLGLKGIQVGRYSESDIYYGNDPVNGYKIRIPYTMQDLREASTEQVIRTDLLDGPPKASHVKADIDFDLLDAIEFFMLDRANQCRKHYDHHQRLRAPDSFQYANNILSIPVVNCYILFLKELIETRTSLRTEPFWPDGKICAIALSHDVDAPDKRCFKANTANKVRALKTALQSKRILLAARSTASLAKFLVRSPFIKQDYWLFEQVMDVEERHGMKSTFFFASRNELDKQGSPFDVSYDISESKFRRIFKAIKERGFAIGLHASYNSCASVENLLREKDKLERIAQTDVLGLRHHAWHLGPEPERTLAYHSQANFQYDTSLAFNDMMGFSRSVAFPFRPWPHSPNQPINTVQIPTFLMDGHFFYNPVSVAEALEQAIAQIKLIKKFRGVGVIDWHVRTSVPLNREFRDWGQAYVNLLGYLAGQDEIWVTSPDEVLRFVSARWAGAGIRDGTAQVMPTGKEYSIPKKYGAIQKNIS